MKLKSPIAYAEWKGDGQIVRTIALHPEVKEFDGSLELTYNEVWRTRVVPIQRVARDTPHELEVITLDGERLRIKPITVAAYRRHFFGRGYTAHVKNQADVDAFFERLSALSA